MRAIVILVIITILCLSDIFVAQLSVQAAGAQTVLEAGQDTRASLDEYLSILSEGKHSVSLYANIGYQYYQLDDLANAILYYEKAKKLSPFNKEVSLSLAQINTELPVQITDIPDFILVRGYRYIANMLTSTIWSMMQLGLGVILLYLIYVYLFKTINMASYWQWFFIGLLVVGIVLTGLLAHHRKSTEVGGDSGISMVSQEVYEGPDERSGSVVSIGPGNKVFLLDTIGDWYKVQLRDKDTGWVKKEGVSLI